MNIRRRVSWVAGMALCASVGWAGVLSKTGTEFSIAGGLAGDQVHPLITLTDSGAVLVWTDNGTDGDGLGIRAIRLNRLLKSDSGPIRVNQTSAGDQENVRAAALPGGKVFLTWQSGSDGKRSIMGRVLGPDGKFLTEEFRISPVGVAESSNPVVAVIGDSTVVVSYAARDVDGSMQGVFVQHVSASGVAIGEPRQANQFSDFNQRDPAMAALPNGRYAVAWISEQQRGERTFDVYARVFNADGSPVGDEFRINSNANVCATPVLAANNGQFYAAWSEQDMSEQNSGWDVVGRGFSANGNLTNLAERLNATVESDQHSPALAAAGTGFVAAWTSLGQDGSREGVVAREISSALQPAGDESLVNSTTRGRQLYPSVVSSANSGAVVVWSAYAGFETGFDLVAQLHVVPELPLQAPAVPTAHAVSSSRVGVSWPVMAGLDIESYIVQFDAASVIETDRNFCTSPMFLPGSEHSVTVSYRLRDGRVSPASVAAVVSTWGEDQNGDGLPDDWQSKHFGADASNWADPSVDSDGDGMSNLREFLAGTGPTNSASVLATRISRIEAGTFLAWTTVPGLVYQVEQSTDLVRWNRPVQPRVASGTEDSVSLNSDNGASYFRVTRIR